MSSTLQGVPVDPTPPASGEGLIFNGSVYVPTPANPGDITAVNTTLPLTGGGVSGALTLDINNFTGDSGAGGLDGAVPAPAAGDAAAGKFLKADGAWAVPPAGGVSLLANRERTSQFQLFSSTFVLVTSMTATVSCTAGKKQEINFSHDYRIGPIGDINLSSDLTTGLFIDGVQVTGKNHINSSTTNQQEASSGIHYIAEGLAAGNHTFEIRAKTSNGATYAVLNTTGALGTSIIMTVKEF